MCWIYPRIILLTILLGTILNLIFKTIAIFNKNLSVSKKCGRKQVMVKKTINIVFT